MSTFQIREITPNDNAEISEVIKSVFVELNAPKEGTAYSDVALNNLYNEYNNKDTIYLVVEYLGKIVGGAGIGYVNDRLDICELQKMYFLPIARGKGLGEKLILKLLHLAKEFGYKKCYIETMPFMTKATALYKRVGFKDLNQPIGNTGHYACTKWMIKHL